MHVLTRGCIITMGLFLAQTAAWASSPSDKAYQDIKKTLKSSKSALATTTTKVRTKPKPFPRVVKRLVRQLSSFIRLYPKAKQYPHVLYTLAFVMNQYNRDAAARALFGQTIQQATTSSYATYAAHHILDQHNIHKRWDALYKAAKRFKAMPKLGNAKFKREVQKIISQAHFKRCTVMRRKHKTKKAARCFEALGTAPDTKSRLGAIALYNAAILYRTQQQHRKCITLLSKIAKHHRLYKPAQKIIRNGCQ